MDGMKSKDFREFSKKNGLVDLDPELLEAKTIMKDHIRKDW